MSALARVNRSNYVPFSTSSILFLSLALFFSVFVQQCTGFTSNDVDEEGEKTLQFDAISNDYCTANIECGFESNSICYNGTCICKLGFHWNPNTYKCQRKRCTQDDQCTAIFANTVCETRRKSCICPTSHTYNKMTQQCISHDSGSSASLQTFCFIAVGSVILLVLVAGGCSGGRWFYLHYRPPSSASSPPVVVAASSMTVNAHSPAIHSSTLAYPPYISKADHFAVVGDIGQHHSAPPPPYQ